MFSKAFYTGFMVTCINTVIASRTNVQVKRFEVCNHTQGLITFNGNISLEKDGKHYITCDLKTPIPFDDNLGCQNIQKNKKSISIKNTLQCAVSIQSKVGKTYMELFVIRERNLCKAGNIYLGEFWYDIQRAAQIPIKVCPMQPGRYRVHHAEVDFNKMSLQTFPFGTLRFILNAIDNKNKSAYMWCLLIDVENLPY